jgi:hypothetical protein
LKKFSFKRPLVNIKNRMPIKNIRHRRLILIITIIVVFIIIISLFGGGSKFSAPVGTTALQTLVEESIQNTFNADTYRFTNQSTLNLNEEQRTFSLLQGEVSDNQNRHISGSILGTPVNIYQIKDTLYHQDPLDGKWRVTSNNNLPSAAHLVSELKPESNFQFETMGEIKNLGKEKVNRKRALKVEFHPVLSDQWIEKYFQDITYILWLDKSRKYILKSQITATSKENTAAKLIIENTFSDFGKKIRIEVPTDTNQPQDNNANQPRDNNANQPQDNNANQPQDNNANQPQDNNANQPRDNNANQPRDNNANQPRDNNANQPRDNNANQPNDNNANQPRDNNANQPAR